MVRVIRATGARKRKKLNILPPKFFNRKIVSWLVVFAIAIGSIALYQAYNAYANPIEKDLIPIKDSQMDSGSSWNLPDGWTEVIDTANWGTAAPDATEDYTGESGGSWRTLKVNQTVNDSVYLWHPFEVPLGYDYEKHPEESIKAKFYYKRQSSGEVVTSNIRWRLTEADGSYIAEGLVNNSVDSTQWRNTTDDLIEIDLSGYVAPGNTYRFYLEHEATTGENGSVQVNFDMARVIWTYTPTPVVEGISASVASIPNDGQTNTKITATVKDQSGAPMPNQDVLFESQNKAIFEASGESSSKTVQTDVYGKAVVYLRSKPPEVDPENFGPVVISAKVGTAEVKTTTITILYPNVVTVTPSKKTIPVGNETPSIIRSAVKDQNGNPMANVNVTFSKSPDSGSFTVGEAVYASTAVAKTNSDGVAEVAFTSNTGGTYTITAEAGSVSNNDTVTVQQPSTLTLTPAVAEPVVISNKPDSKVKIIAVLNDQEGNPIPNKLISFTKSPDQGTLVGTGVKTDANGSVELTFGSSIGDTYQITGTVHVSEGVDISDSVLVKVQEPTTLTFTADQESITNNENAVAEITAKLVDQDGVVIQDEELSFSAAPDLGTLSSYSGTTNADGEVKFNFKPHPIQSGEVTISGDVDRVPTVNVVSEEIDIINYEPAAIQLTASPTSIPDDNYISSTIVALLLDQRGFAIEGATVTFNEDQVVGGEFTTVPSVITNSIGKAQIGFRSGVSGTVNVTAAVGAVHDDIPVTVVERQVASIDLTTLVTNPVIPNNNSTEISIKARLLDQLGYPLSGKNVDFTSESGTLSSGTVSTVNGEAIVRFKSSVAGEVNITGSAGGKTDTVTVDVQTRVPTTLTLTPSQETVIINEQTSFNVTAELKDQFGMPINGNAIKFGYAWGKYQSTETTNVEGKAQITITDISRVGLMTVTARVEDMPFISAITSVEFINRDETPPELLSVESTSKQIVYLTFSERIKTSSLNWELKVSRDGVVGTDVYSIPASNIKVLPGDQRIIRVLLPNSMEAGNQNIMYTVNIQGVTDLNENEIEDPAHREATWDAFTPHGKYSPFNDTSESSTMICARCHAAHNAEGEKLLTSSTVSGVCFVCHDDTGGSKYNIKAQYSRGASIGSKSMHNALDLDIESGKPSLLTCVDCHDPHGIKSGGLDNTVLPKLLATKNPAQQLVTSKDGNYFCLACHGENPGASEFHSKFGNYWTETLGDYSLGMSDDSDDKPKSAHYDKTFDALKSDSGTDITCVKCHESHGSKNDSLIDNNVPDDQTIADNDKDLCYKCHDNDSNSMSNIDIKAEFTKESYHDISDDDIGLGCRSCHEPHTVADRDFEDSDENSPSNISDPTNTKNSFDKSAGVRFSQFCLKCHNKGSGVVLTKVANTNNLIPFTVTLPELLFSGPGWDKTTFTDSAHGQVMECNNCHVPHGSVNNRLGQYPEDSNSAPTSTSGECLRCHGGGATPAGPNVYDGGFDRNNKHNTLTVSGKHSDTENYSEISVNNRHAECYDCHDPHTAKSTGSETAKLGNVLGVMFGSKAWNNWGDAEPEEIILGGEGDLQAYLCYKCHSKYTNQPSGQTDVARDLNRANAARHVVEGSSQMPEFTYNGDSKYYGAFVNGVTATKTMKCTSCHSGSNNDAPHGASNEHILKNPWSNDTGTTQGASSDLCFNCHSYTFYADGGNGNEIMRSQFSNENLPSSEEPVEGEEEESGLSDYRFNLHAAPGHANAGCASCHGAIPHGWNKKDSSGDGGLSLWESSDGVYGSGVAITGISGNTAPGQWEKESCSGCH